MSPCIDPTVAVAAKTIAGTLLDLLTRPDTLAAARAEFTERTSAARFIAPLLPHDFAPPLDYRWPEYITTARGTDWWIPVAPELETPVEQR